MREVVVLAVPGCRSRPLLLVTRGGSRSRWGRQDVERLSRLSPLDGRVIRSCPVSHVYIIAHASYRKIAHSVSHPRFSESAAAPHVGGGQRWGGRSRWCSGCNSGGPGLPKSAVCRARDDWLGLNGLPVLLKAGRQHWLPRRLVVLLPLLANFCLLFRIGFETAWQFEPGRGCFKTAIQSVFR